MIEMRNELSVRCKNGVAFLLAGTIIWAMIAVLFLLPISIAQKNIFTLCLTGLMFPLAVIFSKMVKADWKVENHPLGVLGLYLNVAQFMYFPILLWAFDQNPAAMVVLFAVITGAHFFPYGWFYNARGYYVMAPVISITMMAAGWRAEGAALLWVPVGMAAFLLLLSVWLYVDYRQKRKAENELVTSA
ncbi:hypothetical protein SAMN05192534_10916 [Alteribacillus persepolensis]|uniref:Uncharacterized protein n=1 Tax=Alteribacillus persepolensis TaxID=568899 RepID=A0A1G8EB37_9BACI|nr:hypothetical protein [Alteribacillus persepolensis]SDH67106.1 hypothetical protein SAMN05192534_10916 [Alteribacillus persepolensis]